MGRLLSILVFVFGLSSYAFANQFSLFSGTGFSAPNVQGSPGSYVGNPSTGDIVFDTGNTSFYGYDGASWITLGGTASYTAPTFSIATLVSSTSNTGGFAGSSTTYTTPAGVLYIKVRMVGGGGGGGGSGTATAANGNAGGDTTFDTLTAGHGSGGNWGSSSFSGGSGGTATVGTGWTGIAIPGAAGNGASENLASAATNLMGGPGAGTPFGGGGASSGDRTGTSAPTNSGAGGGGGGTNSVASNFSGSGGGAGGYVEATVSPSSHQTFSYAVGNYGPGGGAGMNGFGGGNGAVGMIVIEEFYQ